MRVIALINPAAGSVGPEGTRRIRHALSDAGHHLAEIVPFDPTAGPAQVRELVAKQPDLLIVWGGDGTHRTVLSVCGRSFDKVLLLPGGTMNLLTRWLHAAKPWNAVLRAALRKATTRKLDAGDVDGKLFFCAMIAGVPAEVARAREDLRTGDVGKAMHDVGIALEDASHIHLTTKLDDGNELSAGNVVAALVGPLAQSAGRMDIVRLNMPTNMGALGVAWSCLRSDWHRPASAGLRSARTFTIVDNDGRDIPAMMDGEQVSVGARFTAHFAENAAACIVGAP